MRRPWTRMAGVVGVLALVWLVVPITAASAATATKVPNQEEAWFLANKEPLAEAPQGDPTCELPTGCNASGNIMRPNPHPEGVLVVAANAGEPDAQMFFNFDTGKLPLGAAITGGTVTLPVAQDPDARNARPEAAKMVACRVTGFIPGGTDGGSYKDRPAFDDKSCVDVKQVKENPLTFQVDLERFGKTWAADPLTMMGITLRVDPAIKPPAPNETWRVAFNTQRRSQQKTEEEKAKPEEQRTGMKFPAITSTLEYKVPKTTIIGPITTIGGGSNTGGSGSGSSGSFPPPETTTTTTTSDGGGGGGGFSSGTDTSVASGDTGSSGSFGGSADAPAAETSGAIEPPADSGAAPVEQPVAAAPTEAAAPAVAAGAAQPINAVGPSMAVWAMPLLALAMAGAMAWSLMQPVELVGEREGAVSKLMRTRRLSSSNTPS